MSHDLDLKMDFEIHSDLDRSNKVSIKHVVALSATGWRLSRGKGPRNHDFCLYCRGDLTDKCEILVHEDGKCKNAWPTSCFLGWLDEELSNYSRALRCPMCRDVLFSRDDFTALLTSKDEIPATLVKVTLFAPAFVLHCALEEKRPVIFMEQKHMQSLKLFGRDERAFKACKSVKFDSNDQTITLQLIDGHTNSTTDVFGSYVLINFGNNIFRMCTFLPKQMEKLRAELVAGGADVRLMSSERFNIEAEERGGLAAALDFLTFEEQDEDMKVIRKAGEEFMLDTQAKREGWEVQAYRYLLRALTRGRGARMPGGPGLEVFMDDLEALAFTGSSAPTTAMLQQAIAMSEQAMLDEEMIAQAATQAWVSMGATSAQTPAAHGSITVTVGAPLSTDTNGSAEGTTGASTAEAEDGAEDEDENGDEDEDED